MSKYMRVPLEVEVVFTTDGDITAKRLFYEDIPFTIDKTLDVRACCPKEVGCIAPIRYTVMIGGKEKELFFEKATGCWFSVREVV